jgi:sec-independent protein translocase protein TatA
MHRVFNQIGPIEIAVAAVIALIVLGSRRLPEAGRLLGQGLAYGAGRS